MLLMFTAIETPLDPLALMTGLIQASQGNKKPNPCI